MTDSGRTGRLAALRALLAECVREAPHVLADRLEKWAERVNRWAER